MNYHVEHHMFPMVPYHALPKLHEKIHGRLPDALSELLGGLQGDHPGRRQVRDPSYFVRRQLPSGATPVPYNHGTRIVPAE